MTWLETLQFLSGCLPRAVGRVMAQQAEGMIREIRIRAGGHACVKTNEGLVVCPGTFTQQQVAQIAEALCEHALYARSEEQRQGFVTLRGGHRMGMCGRVITQGQSIRSLRELSSLCIRVAGQWRGVADATLPYLWSQDGRVRSALIIGQPCTGKTTLLRDICRSLSESGIHMCVVDERSEIAAMSAGVAQLDVGSNTDVLDGCSKEAGVRWMLRAMSPEVLITDELGGATDAQALMEAARSGVGVMATLHGRDAETALARGTLYQLVQSRLFSRYIVLDPHSVGRISMICDEKLRPLGVQEAV